MPLGTFIAGPYNATWNSIAQGLVERGFDIRLRAEKEVIADTHLYGDTILDAVYRGGNCMIAFTGMEDFKQGDSRVSWPYGPVATGSPINPGFGFLGGIGRMDHASSLALALVLTAVAGTTAAASPATLTATNTIRAEGSESQRMFGPTLRKHPVVLRCYPYQVTNPTGYAAGTYEIWFAQA